MYSPETFAACDWIYRTWMREALDLSGLMHLCPGIETLEEIRTTGDLTFANGLLQDCRMTVGEELQRMWNKGWEEVRLRAYDLTFARERAEGLLERRALIIDSIGMLDWNTFVKPARDMAWDGWMYHHLWSLTDSEYHTHTPSRARITRLEGLDLPS